MAAYYNEFDPYAAQWLRNLIIRGHIAPGVVDERSIEDVRPDDLKEFTQCHFFAGIGIWSHALRQAGWSDDRPVWSGSCPCQPFSTAGKGAGVDDERHLWPHFHHLIEQCRPPVIFGEQVASKDGLAWLDLVQTDLEGSRYASGAADLCAAGVGAPHIRQRLYWVGEGLSNTNGERFDPVPSAGLCQDTEHDAESCGSAGRVGDTVGAGLEGHAGNGDHGDRPGRLDTAEDRSTATPGCTNGFWRDADWLPYRDGKIRPIEPGTFPLVNGHPTVVGQLRAYGNAINAECASEFIAAYMESRP